MRKLTREEIDALATRPGVKTNAVKGFLSTMGENEMHAGMNLNQDARAYGWDKKTIKAIRDGINKAAWE